jgi:abortive infection bacteriophage resistance protein
MPKALHQYKQGASFSQVMTLYRFDKKLRLLIFNEIEKIEVAVRSAIVNIGSELTGNPFWMTEGANFTNQGKFVHTMSLIDAEIKYFLDVISPQNDMLDKLLKLLADFPSIDLAAMGFPQYWQQEPLWQKV